MKVKEKIENKITEIKEIMRKVATGQARIQEMNGRYKKLWKKLRNIFRNNNIENPNEFSDLWEFYAYWKNNLETYADRRAYIIKLYKDIDLQSQSITKNNTFNYVDQQRLKQLKKIKSENFDLEKLIRYCEELNLAFKNKMYHSTGMIVRSIIDHVPPLFGCNKFSEVANNYGGTKSFKESMKNLNKSSRKIADSYLHTQIRKKEVLPNKNQIDFSNDLDVLLSEICRILK